MTTNPYRDTGMTDSDANTQTLWSDETRDAIRAALDKLPLSRQERFWDAWRLMLRESQDVLVSDGREALVESWNEYLARVTPSMLERRQVELLYGMWIFVYDYPGHIDHDRIARAVADASGSAAAEVYRAIAEEFSRTMADCRNPETRKSM